MKQKILKHISFISKSVLWSLCLYVIFMLAINWDDIKNSTAGNNPTVIINTEQQQGIFNKPSSIPSSISQHASALKSIVVLVKTICGIGASIGK